MKTINLVIIFINILVLINGFEVGDYVLTGGYPNAIANYKEHSKLYYEIAKHIIKIENPSQIQLITKSKKPASYCRHNFINHIPFIIINENDESWALNHEVQHAIEEIINYETPYFYDELV